MSASKTIAVVGVSEETTAFLRLLLRKLASKSEVKWSWGNEDTADLVVIDPSVLIGEAARVKAESAGVHYAVLLEADQPAEDALVLRHPLDAEQLGKVLAVAAAPREMHASISHVDENFYEPQAPAVAPALREARTDVFVERMHQAKAALLGVGAVDGLEVVIKREREQRDVPDVRSMKLDGATVDGIGIEAPGSSGRRAESKAIDRTGLQGGLSNARDGALSTNSPLTGGPGGIEDGELPYYFDADVLGGPSQIQVGDAPVLTLDPKNDVFHADASLSALEAYCRGRLQRAHWKKLTTAELNVAPVLAPQLAACAAAVQRPSCLASRPGRHLPAQGTGLHRAGVSPAWRHRRGHGPCPAPERDLGHGQGAHGDRVRHGQRLRRRRPHRMVAAPALHVAAADHRREAEGPAEQAEVAVRPRLTPAIGPKKRPKPADIIARLFSSGTRPWPQDPTD
jgi:hypothetical protein